MYNNLALTEREKKMLICLEDANIPLTKTEEKLIVAWNELRTEKTEREIELLKVIENIHSALLDSKKFKLDSIFMKSMQNVILRHK